MLSSKPKTGWDDPAVPRHALRKHRQPLAIYDLTTKREIHFFSYFGKFTLVCIFAFLGYLTVTWAIHRPQSNHDDGPPDFVFTPISAQASQPTPPRLGYVTSWSVTTNSATVSWSTNLPSTTSLAYGTTRSLGQVTPTQSKLDMTHGVKLTGLKGGTTYYYVAQSADKNGTIGYSQICTFTTLPVAVPPKISGITVVPVKNNQVHISWTTSVPTYSYIQIGSTTAYDRYSTRTGLTTNPHPTIAWVPSGTVHYQLVSTDAQGNKTVSPDYTFVEP